MESLPSLDEKDIIGIKSEALGAVSPAHKRFRENQPEPGDDGPFVPIDEGIIPNLSSDVLTHDRSLRSRCLACSTSTTEMSNCALANNLNSRLAVHHSQTLPNTSNSAQLKTSERTLNTNLSAASVADAILPSLFAIAKAPLDEPEILVPGSMYNSRTMMKWRNYLYQLEIRKTEAEFAAAAHLEDNEECECSDSLRSDQSSSNVSIAALPAKLAAATNSVTLKSQRIVGSSVVISAEQGVRIISRSDTELCDVVSSDEDCGPPPPIPEDVWGSDDDEDRGPPPAYDDIAMLIEDAFEMQRRDALPHDTPAAVEFEDPSPEFTEEDIRLQEAICAEQRAKKAAARAAKGQKLLGALASAVFTHEDDATAIGKNASAAVEYEDPPPEFTEEEPRL